MKKKIKLIININFKNKYNFQILSPSSKTLINSSSVNASNLALSICIFYLLRTSINLIYFLNACISSFLYFSRRLLSSTSFSISLLIVSLFPCSFIFASLSCNLALSSSSRARFSLASFEPTS